MRLGGSRRSFAGLLFVLLVGLAGGSVAGCGYSLAGRGSSLPVTIQTIGVPLFTNTTSAFDLEQVLTERVRLEFISRGKYRVMPDAAGSDAALIGEIIAVSVTPTSFTANQQASRYALTMVIKVEFRDLKTNKLLYENPALQFREEYELAGGITASDPNAFLGQGSEARDRIVNDFARSVVSSILEAF